jgi:putative tryptophan/tyrosine transport system substrate-binding protein
MNRREWALALVAFGAAAVSANALAQVRQVRIGVLGPRPRSVLFPAALKRLGELGYVEGRNMVVEYRSAEGVVERFPTLARELILARCDLIFAVGAEHPARALLDAKTGIPIVILAHDYDPVRAGIVSNLRRPGGNVTGMVNPEAAVAAKRLELLREALPKSRRFLLLADRFSRDQLEAVHEVARRLHVELVAETFATPPYDYDAAFARGRVAGIDAVVVLDSPVFADQGTRISQLLVKHRLPAATFRAVVHEPGFLIGYGIDATKAYAPAGDIAARILKGARPGDIAVEQVTAYEFVVNLRTAKAFGMSIPQSIAVRADRAIE